VMNFLQVIRIKGFIWEFVPLKSLGVGVYYRAMLEVVFPRNDKLLCWVDNLQLHGSVQYPR